MKEEIVLRDKLGTILCRKIFSKLCDFRKFFVRALQG